MIFTERIEKLLGTNQIKEVIDEFLKFLGDVPHHEKDARNDANQIRSQVIILSGRYTDLHTKINTNTIDQASANQEKSSLINSFLQILNQIPSNYPDLNSYMEEKNEDDEWEVAQEKNSIEAYQDYFSKYPNGKYKAATIKLIGELQDVKQKQDEEIKRLAKLEKERRASEKVTRPVTPKAPVQRPSPNPVYQQPARPVEPAKKTNAGLYIALGILLGIVLIVVIAVSVDSDEPLPPANYPAGEVGNTTNTGSSTVSESLKAELMTAIALANSAEVNALYSLDPTGLRNSFTGEALKLYLAQIETLRSNDLFVTAVLKNQEYQKFQIDASGKSAEVKLSQTWSFMYSRISTQQCHSQVPTAILNQNIYLNKQENGWMITSVVQPNANIPEPEPCSGY